MGLLLDVLEFDLFFERFTLQRSFRVYYFTLGQFQLAIHFFSHLNTFSSLPSVWKLITTLFHYLSFKSNKNTKKKNYVAINQSLFLFLFPYLLHSFLIFLIQIFFSVKQIMLRRRWRLWWRWKTRDDGVRFYNP